MVRIEKGKQLNKELLSSNGLYPAYNGGISYSGFTDIYNYDENKIIISQGGASAGFVNFIKQKFYANAHCYVILPNESIVLNKFIYYVLKNRETHLMDKQHGAGIPALKSSEISSLLIPIPPMRVQTEIVRILDEYTEKHEALKLELSAELDLRKKQYYYYREKLLTFTNDTAEFLPLGEVGEYIRGITYRKQDEIDKGEGHKVLRANNISLNLRELILTDIKIIDGDITVREKHRLKKDDILICAGSGSKEHIGKTAYIFDNLDYTFGGFMGVIRTNQDVLLSRFLFHYLGSSAFSDYLKRELNSSTINNLNTSIMNRFIIPIPPIEEQERIVAILDKFDSLVNSLSEGLPAEINLRQKQYEYYRNALLSFN